MLVFALLSSGPGLLLATTVIVGDGLVDHHPLPLSSFWARSFFRGQSRDFPTSRIVKSRCCLSIVGRVVSLSEASAAAAAAAAVVVFVIVVVGVAGGGLFVYVVVAGSWVALLLYYGDGNKTKRFMSIMLPYPV